LQICNIPEAEVVGLLYSATVRLREESILAKVSGKDVDIIGFAPTNVITQRRKRNWKGDIEINEEGKAIFEDIPMAGEFLVIFAGTQSVIGVHPSSVEFD